MGCDNNTWLPDAQDFSTDSSPFSCATWQLHMPSTSHSLPFSLSIELIQSYNYSAWHPLTQLLDWMEIGRVCLGDGRGGWGSRRSLVMSCFWFHCPLFCCALVSCSWGFWLRSWVHSCSWAHLSVCTGSHSVTWSTLVSGRYCPLLFQSLFVCLFCLCSSLKTFSGRILSSCRLGLAAFRTLRF